MILDMGYRIPLSPQVLEEKKEEIKSFLPIFDMVDIHVVITDENANILYMNKAAEKKTGYTKEEALGKTPGDLWGGTESNEFYDEMWTKIKTQKTSFVTKVTNKRKDGTALYQQLNITPILGEVGNVKYFIAIEPDITDEQTLENNLQDQVAVLFQSLIDKETTLSQLKQQITTLPIK